MTNLERVKMTLRIVTNAFDEELNGLLAAAESDLGIAGVLIEDVTDPLIVRAMMTYCKINFGTVSAEESERLKKSYDEQKAQMQMSCDYSLYDHREG